MARRWIVLTVARAPHALYEIIAYTEWAGYQAASDEVVYTDPVDGDGNAVDALWKVSGSVTLAAGIYTYLDPGTEPTLANRQRSQIHSSYKIFQATGRTGHWAALRAGLVQRIELLSGSFEPDIDTQFMPLDATDKWGFHITAKLDLAILGLYPVSGPLAPAALQGLIDHDTDVLITSGPTWYQAQTDADRLPTPECIAYARMGVSANDLIYNDTSTVLGVPRQFDGVFESMAVRIRAGFNPELRTLGN